MAKFKKGALLLQKIKEDNLLTVEDLAESIGCSIEHARAIHSGSANLTVEHLKTLQEKGIFNSEEINLLKEAYGYGRKRIFAEVQPPVEIREHPSDYTVIIPRPTIPAVLISG
jgi:transcriptional regulator with XRE-family HTH domain